MLYNRYSVNGILFDIPEGVTHFKFVPSNQCNVSTHLDVIIFEFTFGVTADEFCRLASLTAVYPECVLIPYLIPTKIEINYFDINGKDEFLKICHENINLTQLRYKISEDYLINKYFNLIYLIGVEGEFDIDEYYQRFEDTGLLIPVNRVTELNELGNIEIHNSRVHRIKSDRVYLPLSKYRQYRISSLDYIVDFFSKLSKVFEDYGFELVEYEKLKEVETHNVVTFKIGTHSKEFIKRINVRIPEHDIMFSGSKIQFILSTPDTDIYEDFKMRYNNLDLIQNLREFKCEDKYGAEWRYDCIWQGEVDESFAHEFSTTDFGTAGYQFQFSATLEYFDVYDHTYSLIEDIIKNYVITGPDGKVPVEETDEQYLLVDTYDNHIQDTDDNLISSNN